MLRICWIVTVVAALSIPHRVWCKEIQPILRIYSAKESVLLGVDEKINIQVNLPKNISEFDFQVLYGNVEDISVKKHGRKIYAKYTPPKQFFPAVDFIVLTASDGENLVWGLATIRLIGQGKAKIITAPNATTHVRIGQKTFGPATADESGEAFVDVQVPPGIDFGIDDEGNEVDLQVPPLQRAAIFTSSGPQINLDETTEEELLLVQLDESGRPEKASVLPVVKADFGAVEGLMRTGSGVYLARYIVPKTPQVVTLSVSSDGVEIHTQKIEIVGAENYKKTTVKIEPELPKQKSQPVRKPINSDKTRTPGELRFFIAGMIGVNTNFSGWLSPSGKLSFAVRIPKRPLFGVGYQFGILHNTQSQDFDVLERVNSKTLLFSNSLFVWYRIPLISKWFCTPSLGAGIALAHNRITERSDDDGEIVSEEKKMVFIAEGGVALERELGPGMFFFQLGFEFVNANLLLLKGKLITGEMLLGYRFAFGL